MLEAVLCLDERWFNVCCVFAHDQRVMYGVWSALVPSLHAPLSRAHIAVAFHLNASVFCVSQDGHSGYALGASAYVVTLTITR